MTSTPARPALRERYENRRAAIIDACARAFAEQGYDGTSIEDLGRATGLTAGGLYHYIGSKDAALHAVLDQLMDPLLDRAHVIIAQDSPAVERLHDLIVAWVKHVAEYRFHMLVFSQERHVLEKDGKHWSRIRRKRRDFKGLLAQLIIEAREEVSPLAVEPNSDQLVTLAVLGMVNYTPTWLKPKGPIGANEIADTYLRMILAAVSTDPI